jgi:HD-like signal output (HDOD) protein
VANLIAQDAAMTAKILQLSNSALFGVRRRISDPKDAVLYLGLDTLKALALGVKVFSQFTVRPLSHFSIDALGNHTMLAGILARKIATAEGASKHEIEDSFMAGLLHDIGKLVLVSAVPERYEEAMKLAEMGDVPLCAAERQIFGTTHSEVGTYLLWLWGLPDSVVEAVAYHHVPGCCPARQFGPLTAVHAANVLAHESRDANGAASIPGLDMEYLDQLGLSGRVPVWQSLLEQAGKEHKAA